MCYGLNRLQIPSELEISQLQRLLAEVSDILTVGFEALPLTCNETPY